MGDPPLKSLLPSQPADLGKLNERQVLRILQTHGPLSRADVARKSGLSAPTVSKAAAALLRKEFVQEHDAPEVNRGRPAKILRLANDNVQVLGVVVDAELCEIVSAGLDGQVRPETLVSLDTPRTYPELIDALAERLGGETTRDGISTLGVAITLPGLIDYRTGRGILSPNLPITNDHAPAEDLEARLGIKCMILQESHALCLAEQSSGLARGMQDFAMLDVSTGVGLGVVSGSRLLTGHNGFAGEVGHITVQLEGRPCGCGNRGCLETMASDASLVTRISQRLGRRLNIDQVIELARSGKFSFEKELEETCRYLAIGVAAVVNLFNPAAVFIHGRQFEMHDRHFDRLIEFTRQRVLPPSLAECKIVQAKGSKKLGAIAGIIQQLTESIAPTYVGPSAYNQSRSFNENH